MKTGMKKSRAYTISEAAKKLGISRQAVHQAIHTKRLEAEEVKIVQKVRLIPAAALKDYRVSISHKQRGKKN